MDDLLKNAQNAIQSIPQNVANFVGGSVNAVQHAFQPPIQSPIPQQQMMPQAQPSPVQNLFTGIGREINQVPSQVGGFLGQQAQYALQNKNMFGQQNTMPFGLANPFAPAPRVNIPQFNTGNGIRDFLLNIPGQTAQSVLNAPSDIQKALPKDVQDIQSGAIKNPGTALQDIAQTGLPIATLATLGGGSVVKGIAEDVGKEAGYQALGQALKEGAITGAGYGGAFGILQGLASSDQLPQQLTAAGKQGLIGAGTGGLLGGATGVIANRLGAMANILQQKYGMQPEEATQEVRQFARDELGRFTGILNDKNAPANLVRKKLGIPQNEPVYYGDLRESLGLPRNGDYEMPQIGLSIKEVKHQPVPGEQSISMDDVAENAPELTTAKGVNKVDRVLQNAKSLKPEFDQDIKAIADDNGAEFSSRIKSMDSSIRKITQQRMEGKDGYNEKGLNDPYGARIVIPDPKDEKNVISDIHDAANDGQFEILKEQSVDKETYHAYHMDIQKRLPDGRYVRGEIQIHTPQSLAEAVKNHPIRSVFGENPPEPIDEIKKANAATAHNLTNEEAKQATDILLDKHKQVGEVNTLKDELSQAPLPPRMSSKAIEEGIEQPRTGRDISVSPQAAQRFKAQQFLGSASGNPEPLPWEADNQSKPAPIIPTDESAKNQANVMGGGFTGNLDPEVKSKFADWVNARNATPIENRLVNNKFTELNQRGLQGMLDYQSEEKTPEFAGVKNYFDNKRQQVINATGRDFGYKKDYLPQLWKESPEQVSQVMGNRLSQSAQFTLHSLIQDYEEGISKGLHPRFNTVGELAGWYEQKANKLIADSNFFNYLAEKGLIQPKSKAPDWVSLDPDRFPKIQVHLPEGSTYNGVYSAPKPLADMINNYLRPAGDNWFTKLGNMASFMKQMVMSTGIPGTAITPHTFNELVRALAFKNPITGEARAIGYSLFPKLAGNWIDGNLEKASFWAKNGLKFNAIEETPKEGIAGMINKVNIFNRHEDLFGKVIPALKMQYADQLFGRLKGQGMQEDQAAKLSAQTSNTIFGGINWESWGRSRDNMKIASTIGFAPDWLETNARIGTGIAKALLNPADPKGRAYLTFAGNLAAAYALANVINYHNTGKLMIQNPNGHEFDIAIGFTSDGQVRYIRPFGTGIDFVRLPVEVGAGLAKGDFSGIPNLVRNRLSTFIGTALSLVSNTDYLGQGIYTDFNHPDISTLQSIGNIAATVGSGVLPGVATQGIKALAGGFQGPEQSISALLGSPLRYSGGASTQSIVKQGLAQGKTGQQITQDIGNMVQRAQNKSSVVNGISVTGANGKVDPNLTSAVKDAVALYYDTQSNDWQTRLMKDQLLTSTNLFNAIKDVAMKNASGDTSKVDPLLTADDQTRKDYLTYERLYNSAAGSAEEKQFIKNHSDVLQLMQNRNTYFTANPVAFSQARASIFGSPSTLPPAPQASSYVQQQLNAKNYNDPQVQQYLSTHLDYVNQLRKEQGLDPVDKYGNIQGSKNFGVTFASNGGIPAGFRRALTRESRYVEKSGNNKVKNLIGKMNGNYKPVQKRPISIGGKLASIKLSPSRAKIGSLPRGASSTMSVGKPRSIATMTRYTKPKKQRVRLA